MAAKSQSAYKRDALRRVAALVPLPTEDQYRWLRWKYNHQSTDQIAEEDNISVATAARSIARIERRRVACNLDEIKASEMAVLHFSYERQARALVEALDATKKVQRLDELGRPVVTSDGTCVIDVVPDHGIRLQAQSQLTDKFNALQPKGPATKVDINNLNGNIGGPSRSIRGFEERLKEIRERRQGLLPAAPDDSSTGQITDAEIEGDPDEDQ